jgi:hypothetical protein
VTKEHQEFDYYCLDRCKVSEEFPITYSDGAITHKRRYKLGLRTKIKRQDCFILYTDTDDDLDSFIYISAETFYNCQQRFFTDIFTVEEYKEIIKVLTTINIFEYTSLLNFDHIYGDFLDVIEENWDRLDMDNLIEI